MSKIGEQITILEGIKYTYGNVINCDETIKKLIGKLHKCPACQGKGYKVVTYNSYPEGLPDSGYVYREALKNVTCELCHGEGYTEKKYRPKMVQQGWEEDV